MRKDRVTDLELFYELFVNTLVIKTFDDFVLTSYFPERITKSIRIPTTSLLSFVNTFI